MKMKSILILVIVSLSIMSGPLSAYGSAQSSTGSSQFDSNVNAEDALKTVGSIFGMFRGFGASGEQLGKVLQMMFENFIYMNGTQKISGVYVMNGSIQSNKTTENYTFGSGKMRDYLPWGVYNLKNSTNSSYQNEYPYLRLRENGTLTVTKEDGVALTFIIWDNDATLIRAIDKLLETVRKLITVNNGSEFTDAQRQDANEAALEAITYFLIHVNDIITGDEVIIMNLVGYTSYTATNVDGGITAQWYVTQNRQKTSTVKLENVLPFYESQYRALAQNYSDKQMLYYLDKSFETRNTQNYTRFSFDLVELWLKNFEIHINVQKIIAIINEASSGQEPTTLQQTTLTDVFQGLDIEFYIITHHFQNWYLYDDNKFENLTTYDESTQAQITSKNMVNNDVPDVIYNATSGRIIDSEVTDYIVFRDAKFSFIEPIYDTVNNEMTWAVRGENLNFRVIPMGLKDSDVNMAVSPLETMEYFQMGFKFAPWKDQSVNSTDFQVSNSGNVQMGMAKVKLEQSFGKWNGNGSVNTPRLNGTSLDLTTVYMSTILHFHLSVKNTEEISDLSGLSENQTQQLINDTSYKNEKGSLFVGDVEGSLPLAEVNITGPDYEQNGVKHPAKSIIIPTMFAEYDVQAQEGYVQKDNSFGVMGANLTISVSVVIYAVSYPTFNTSGAEIVHDPTFSIYITFENPGVLAIILVVGVVALVGIAAILVTKKKNSAV